MSLFKRQVIHINLTEFIGMFWKIKEQCALIYITKRAWRHQLKHIDISHATQACPHMYIQSTT